MSEEKKIHRSHRLCPCNPMDIEGIQTWLEDMAQDGLILEKESVFFGFWSFEKSTPQKVLYRLEVVQGKFLEDTDTPQLDMLLHFPKFRSPGLPLKYRSRRSSTYRQQIAQAAAQPAPLGHILHYSHLCSSPQQCRISLPGCRNAWHSIYTQLYWILCQCIP